MKRISIIITLLLFLASCGNKTYYENDKKVAKLLCIENGIAKIKYYDDVNEREETFVKRMKKILKFYNIENNIFELYSSASLDYYKMDIKDIDPDELLIVNNTLVEEEITTDEYRKYETTDFLSNEEIMKVCDSNRGTPNERDVIRFYHQKGYFSYAYAHKRNNNSYNIFWPEKNEIYSAESIENRWEIREVLDTVTCNKSKTDYGWVFNIGGNEIKMIEVKGGTFYMGATKEHEEYKTIGEVPVHKVSLKGFYIAECEVTQQLWNVIMGSNPSEHKGAYHPVENINREDCLLFIERLNRVTGEQFNLPTEAQWEYAARGGHKAKEQYLFSGSNYVNDVAWHKENSGNTTHRVKSKKPNQLGIYDMSGNVWEYCLDYYSKYKRENATEPLIHYGKEQVLRGGSYSSMFKACRNSYRISSGIGYKSDTHGLRLCLKIIE